MRRDPFEGLKDFQRNTAAHVDRMLFDEGRSRFLVADEVGLGKTLVARGVIGRALQRFEEQGVKRIDIVYISSNAEIGRQNIRRLVPEGYEAFQGLDRLTLLPLHLHNLNETGRPNFVAFTPGTLPDANSRLGWSRERALIYALLSPAWDMRGGKGPIRLLMHPVRKEETFRDEIATVRSLKPDQEIGARFVALVEADPGGLRAEFDELADKLRNGTGLSDGDSERRLKLVARLRLLLATACVDSLEPDLVILDEFQRFRHLLDDHDNETAQLFQAICEYTDGHTAAQTKVLLLSATPYKMYTGRDDAEDHHADFVKTLSFLMDRDQSATAEVAALLQEYREAIRGRDAAERVLATRDALAERLRTVMVRTERLAVSADRSGMLDAVPRRHAALSSHDVKAFVEFETVLRDAGERAGATGLEYWKSSPYPTNFMDQYVIKNRLKAAATDGPTAHAIARRWRSGAGLLPFDAVRAYRQLPSEHSRLRCIERDVIDTDLWRLLWLPSSLRYYELGAPFADAASPTKRLVFSSWKMAPRAIAALTSYEAERRMIRSAERYTPNTPESRIRLDRRLLDFRVSASHGERRAAMPVFALIYPSVALATIDPLVFRRERAQAGLPTPTLAETRQWAASRVTAMLPPTHDDPGGPADARWYWAAPLILDGPDGTRWLSRPGLAQKWADSTAVSGWEEHLQLAITAASGELDPPLGCRPDGLVEALADMALAAPGVVALRSLGRVLGENARNEDAVREAAGSAAWGLRALLNGPEAIAVVRGRSGDVYWRAALRYCVAGGLQAVLDEFTHLTFDLGNIGRLPRDKQAAEIADVIRRVTSMRTGRVVPDEISVDHGKVVFTPHRMRSRFARAYGQERNEDDVEGVTTAAAVREAFNSPFPPFVLASTSVGQEGLDFHPYCHAVVHWNLPSNPVDFEQREGRVHRYKGHAVRKNVAAAVADSAFTHDHDDPWRSVFAAAEATPLSQRDPDIVPYWVFPGDARIERHIPVLPLSRDEERLQQMLRSLALYRSVIGQPRQEELVELLTGQDLPDGLTFEDLRIDLSPRG